MELLCFYMVLIRIIIILVFWLEERRLIAVILLLSIMVAILGVMALDYALTLRNYPVDVFSRLESLEKAVVTGFDARFNNGTLVMELTYKVNKEGLSMLYYTFDSPLRVYNPAGPGEIVVRYVVCPRGMHYYVLDADGNLYTDLSGDEKESLLYKLKAADAENEVGCYSPSGLSPGKSYTVRYVLELVPPRIYYDGSRWLYYMDLVGGEEHLYIHNLTVRGEYYTRIAVLPPLGDGEPRIVYTVPLLGKNTGVKLAVITSSGAMPETSIVKVDSVDHVIVEEIEARTLYSELGFILMTIPIIIAIASPAILYMLYNVYGRERAPTGTVPYGFPPETGEKPWEVAAIYGPSPGKISYNVVTATLLDLCNREIIRVEENGEITLLSREGLDPLEDLIVKAIMMGKKASRDILLNASEIVKRRAEEAVEGAYRWILFLLIAVGVASSIAGLIVYAELLEASPARLFLIGLLLPILAYAPGLLAPRYLLGRWRLGYRERAIAWHDFAQKIGKAPQSSMSPSTRLAPYIAALASPRKAKRILRSLGIEPPVLQGIYRASRGLIWRYRLLSSAGGRGGGGFGGGGPGAR